MAANKDVQVLGSQSAAEALFLANAAAEAQRPENHAATAYWFKLAVQAAQAGNHLYPLT